jgi:hypothetical protein
MIKRENKILLQFFKICVLLLCIWNFCFVRVCVCSNNRKIFINKLILINRRAIRLPLAYMLYFFTRSLLYFVILHCILQFCCYCRLYNFLNIYIFIYLLCFIGLSFKVENLIFSTSITWFLFSHKCPKTFFYKTKWEIIVGFKNDKENCIAFFFELLKCDMSCARKNKTQEFNIF